MKKSKSRGKSISGGSKKDSNSISLDADVSLHIAEFLPGLLETRWQEILEDEERDLMILEIRDEIVNESIDLGYNNYLERQTISFAVHCSALAWIKLLDWNFMLKDPGEPCVEGPSWSTDVEPETISHDTWAAKVLPVQIPEIVVQDTVLAQEASDIITVPSFEVKSIESFKCLSTLVGKQRAVLAQELRKILGDCVTHAMDLAHPSESTPTMKCTTSVDAANRRRSTFTRVLTLPKEHLPKREAELYTDQHPPGSEGSRSTPETRLKRQLVELMSQHAMTNPMPPRSLPEDRIGVKYVIPSAAAGGDARRNKTGDSRGQKKSAMPGRDKKPNVIRLK